MISKLEINNPVLKVSNEHTVLLDSLEKLDLVLLEPEPAIMFSKLGSIQESLQQLLSEHFRFEEQVLFPALLIGIPVEKTVERVLKLSSQHGVMLTHIEYLQNLVQLFDPDNPSHVRLFSKSLTQLMDLLKIHVKIEMEDVFPMISQNQRCCQLMESFWGNKGNGRK